jgi:hypothetical protein
MTGFHSTGAGVIARAQDCARYGSDSRVPRAILPARIHRVRRPRAVLAAAMVGIAAIAVGTLAARAAENADLREQAEDALRKAATFFRTEVSVEGSYLWQYSEDLSKREGEGKATATQGWIQPPGTPSVGRALLEVFEATGDAFYRDAVRETAKALARGQLVSGGWNYFVDFDPQGRRPLAYRAGPAPAKALALTVLDDNTTQEAVRFLAATDRALGFKDSGVRDTVVYALQSLLKAQYPNGAWPQRYDGPPDPAQFPVRPASYPDSWSRTFPAADYSRFYTINDQALPDMIETMLEVSRIYRDPAAGGEMNRLAAACRAAALKAGDFLLLAQLPDPQPAWAQQYDADMHPAWARKFEPPAVTGGGSQAVLETLLLLYRQTGDRKYLAPLPKALEYLAASRRPDGKLARFYELKTNKPLYFTKDYKLTYDDADMPTHYAFVIGDRTAGIRKDYEAALRRDPAKLPASDEPVAPRLTDKMTAEAKAAIAALDEKGRWVEDGKLRYHGDGDPTRRVIRCETFIRRVGALSRYLAATRPAAAAP